jgi:two-component system chemotaxis sensor kinase CheA
MDVADYLPLFLAEAREHLQELSLAVIRIEERPDDRETVDQVFRIAHSLKGMSSTMGFAAMAALTHQMEDVFELLRQRRGGLDRKAVDVLLECLDAIALDVDAIEQDGAERLDPAALIDRLKRLIRPRSVAQHAERQGGGVDPEEALARARGRTLRVLVRLADDCPMPGVRAYMVLAAIADHGELLGSTPSADGVERFEGRAIEAFVATGAPADTVADAVRGVGDIAEVTVREEISSPGPAAPAPAAEAPQGGAVRGGATVRIDAGRLDQLMRRTSELVAHRRRLESLVAEARAPGLHQAMQDLARSSQALQALVLHVRMIPVESVFLRVPRLVRDLSAKLGKQVELVLVGKETELDRTVVEALADPIVHLVRNSLDHGLETPEQRLAAGKRAVGTLEIAARHAGGHVVITVRDDGRGIDPARVAARAAERGLLAPGARGGVDMAQAAELLFSPGFTTVEQVTAVSGRGVGLDAARTAIRELGGDVELASEPGAGSTVSILLPVTLASMAALHVEADGTPFAIPLERVERTLRLGEHAVRPGAGGPVLVLDDGELPLIDLGGAAGADRGHAVVVHAPHGRAALAVERLVGRSELITRPVPAEARGHRAVSGGAVLPNGDVALVVDCDAISDPAARVPARAA